MKPIVLSCRSDRMSESRRAQQMQHLIPSWFCYLRDKFKLVCLIPVFMHVLFQCLLISFKTSSSGMGPADAVAHTELRLSCDRLDESSNSWTRRSECHVPLRPLILPSTPPTPLFSLVSHSFSHFIYSQSSLLLQNQDTGRPIHRPIHLSVSPSFSLSHGSNQRTTHSPLSSDAW